MVSNYEKYLSACVKCSKNEPGNNKKILPELWQDFSSYSLLLN